MWSTVCELISLRAKKPKEECIEPKATDMVEVVRCKDCKHFDGYFCHNKWLGDTPQTKEGFCDWAERKENDSSVCEWLSSDFE